MQANLFFNNDSPKEGPSVVPSKESPELSLPEIKAEESKPNEIFTYPVKRLIKKYQEIFSARPGGETTPIHVDEIASKVAHFYERIRKIVDWKEENLLRRNAIVRILKRSLVAEISNLQFIFRTDIGKVAEPLILELIRGGHLPNDEVPVEKIEETGKIIKKYFYFLKNAPFTKAEAFFLKKKVNFYDWIMEVAACEIEELLSPPRKENALIETMTALMNDRIKVLPEGSITDEDKLIQTYIATHRTLYDLDDGIIAYHLLRFRYPQWINPSDSFLSQTAGDIFKIWEKTEEDLKHPLSKQFFNICERTDTVFTFLDDVLESMKSDPEAIPETFADRTLLRDGVTVFYRKRYKTLKSRLFKMAVFSTLSVFISNWFTFFIIEIPVAKLFYEGFNPLAAAVDFIVPSLAMFILVAIIRPPSASNLNKVIEMINKFVYADERKDIFEIRFKKKRKLLTGLIIGLIYLVGCLLGFGAVAWVFYLATIPISSVILDTINIAMNVFAALVIRNKSKEITVEEKTSFGEFLLDIISVPVAEVGSWLGNKWKEYNVVSVFFNVIIEMPFITLIQFIEDWRNFLKEKKAEIH